MLYSKIVSGALQQCCSLAPAGRARMSHATRSRPAIKCNHHQPPSSRPMQPHRPGSAQNGVLPADWRLVQNSGQHQDHLLASPSMPPPHQQQAAPSGCCPLIMPRATTCGRRGLCGGRAGDAYYFKWQVSLRPSSQIEKNRSRPALPAQPFCRGWLLWRSLNRGQGQASQLQLSAHLMEPPTMEATVSGPADVPKGTPLYVATFASLVLKSGWTCAAVEHSTCSTA